MVLKLEHAVLKSEHVVLKSEHLVLKSEHVVLKSEHELSSLNQPGVKAIVLQLSLQAKLRLFTAAYIRR